MHGFFGSYKAKVAWDLSGFDDKSFVKRTHSEGDFQLTQVTLPKFLNDKYFAEIDDCFLATEGVLFEADKPEDAIARYRNGNTTFWNSWRGSFAGVLYDSKTDTLIVFNDHIGSKMLFYAQTKEGFVFASCPYAISHTFGLKAINEGYLWHMLIYGYSPIGGTVFNQIYRLQAGEYFHAQGHTIKKRIYHRFDNTPNNFSLEENIERIDATFRQAVTRAIIKNEEYGYLHFLPLSAGLDSRMSNCVAHSIAQTPIHHITYSQSGFYDEIIPRELARYWGDAIHFTPLDGGDCLIALDTVSRMTYGLVQYSGAAETWFGLPKEAKENAGIFLTGMVGDIIIGTAFTKCNPHQKYHIGEGSIIPGYTDLIRRTLPADFESRYQNRELYYLYTRGFNCANLGSPLIHQAVGESYSPFCDVDLLETAYAIPVEQRWQHHLYDQWILSKYPDMAQWKHNGLYSIGHRPRLVSFFGRAITINEIPKRMAWFVLKKMHIHDFYRETTGKTMTPEDDWFKENGRLAHWSDAYIKTNMHLLEPFPKVQNLATRFATGNATERMQVLSLLASLRQAFQLIPS